MTFANIDGVSTGIRDSPPRGQGRRYELQGRIVTALLSRARGNPAFDPGWSATKDQLFAGSLALLRRDGECVAARDDAVPSGLLCGVERLVGRGQELLRRGRRRQARDAEAGGDPQLGPVVEDDGRRLDRLPDALGELRAAGEVGAGEDERELLPAPASRGVDLADGRVEDPSHRAQHDVAGRVPVAVVHALEAVDVEEDERHLAALRTCDARDLDRERLLGMAAVREPGETVDERLPLDDAVEPRVL